MELNLIILLFTLIHCNQASEALKTTPYNSAISSNRSTSDQLIQPKILSKQDWLGRPATGEYIKLDPPVSSVIIIQTATGKCHNQETCTVIVRNIQNFHMTGVIDIAYNFLVGGDGYIYTGRGWNNEGDFSSNYNHNGIGIALIGNFANTLPTSEQIMAAKLLIQMGVEKRFISENYKLLGHRQVSHTRSPGNAFYEIIKTWPHWSNITVEHINADY